MSSTGANVNRDSVLRHRHAREVDGVVQPFPAHIQTKRGHEEEDFIVLRPPKRPKEYEPTVFTPLVNALWRVGMGISGIIGFHLMEPMEQFFLSIFHFPAYTQSALRRLHYYLTGE
ncbi:hypothetical protein MBRA1_000572 [Malassezia brasiliensis]|uniref:Uncharacterized protein n=1 Tax=Malassezia brasiliensis TaxID=1821822 RepID=A0AAF0INQ1_9BASI|nr:hypothetical protein MBRA1_000572 [Malassezia brasiliensis]